MCCCTVCVPQGGKDAASARYIYTRLATLTRHLFHEQARPASLLCVFVCACLHANLIRAACPAFPDLEA